MTNEALMDLRQRVLRQEMVSPEELRNVIAFLRQDRLTAQPKKKGKDSPPPMDSAKLLSLLDI